MSSSDGDGGCGASSPPETGGILAPLARTRSFLKGIRPWVWLTAAAVLIGLADAQSLAEGNPKGAIIATAIVTVVVALGYAFPYGSMVFYIACGWIPLATIAGLLLDPGGYSFLLGFYMPFVALFAILGVAAGRSRRRLRDRRGSR